MYFLDKTLPYSAETITAFMIGYNESLWPVHLAATILILIAIFALLRPFSFSNRLITGIFTMFWIWVGGIFYLKEFPVFDFLAPVYGMAFLLQAALFIWFSLIKNQLKFEFSTNKSSIFATLFIISALVVYPICMGFYEDSWSSYRLAGITPFATVLLTLGFLCCLKTLKSIKIILSIIPLLYVTAAILSLFLMN